MKKFTLLLFFSLCYINVAAQWTEQYSGDTVIFKSVSAVDNNIAWFSGDIQRVYRTTNGGNNWNRTSTTGLPYPISLVNIFAINEKNALVAGTFTGDRTFVFRTSNGGNSWNQVFTQTNGFINSIWMADSMSGFIQGDPVNGRWSLWKTVNGGITWDSTGLYLPSDGDEYGFVNSMYLNSENGINSIWFGTNNYKVYYSNNYGSSWNSQITPASQYINSIWFSSPNSGMRGGSGTLKTSNSGHIWSSSSNIFSSGGIAGVDQKWWSIDYFMKNIFYSSDNGESWNIQFSSDSSQFTHISIARNFTNQYSVWAVGNPGKIFKYNTTVGISQNNSIIPTDYILSQNYPNPFNPVTVIDYIIPSSSFVKITLFDNIGKEVRVLVNEYKNKGSYSIKVDGNNLNSGIYFYTMKSNDFSSVRKMIIVK
ncbi:MAG TPA: T9SS type A sorting domain-containing protein [Ignavibacteria bacterium]|nr:T9SS type A sorting domain-containing protein [Ignavibacteria bacterium]